MTVLPATDLYLNGREYSHLIPRGVAPAHRLAAQGAGCDDRDKQCDKSVHAVRRRVADEDGQPLCQCRADRLPRRTRKVFAMITDTALKLMGNAHVACSLAPPPTS